MATGIPSPRRKPRENQYLFELGVRGRKTGLTVPDSGIRDEHGLEPMDELFSSPNTAPKSNKAGRKSVAKTANATISSEEDMEMGESTIPEPTAVLTERKRSSMRMPPPRSKSPIKTFLQSPARRNPSLGLVSSPTRGSIISPSRANVHTSVNRRLDFSVDDLDRNYEKVPIRSSPLKHGALQKISFTEKLTNGTRFSPAVKTISARKHQQHQEQEQYEPLQPDYDLDLRNGGGQYEAMGDDYDLDDGYQDDQYAEPASSPEVDAESPLQATKKRRGAALTDEPVAKKSKGKPQSGAESSRGMASSRHVIAATKPSVRSPIVKPVKGPTRSPKLSKSSNKEITKKSAPKKAERKESSPVSSSPIIQRGPPRPKNNRGLYILRRETPDDGPQTRSGRHVIKPVAYWKNETVVYGDDEEADGDASFLLPTVKEVIRADDVEQPKAKRARRVAGAGRSKKIRQESESEEDDGLDEPWELEPGRVYGAIRTWNPEDPIGEESAEKEDEIALSSAAIITRDIAGASFRFAKTLTLPFFGSGMVDLPPGAIKKPKNSRRMQLVFFVFSGRVNVMVNDSTFRIGKGGMWQVPRGNFYSIENDYEKPARIFFSQGCEVIETSEAY